MRQAQGTTVGGRDLSRYRTARSFLYSISLGMFVEVFFIHHFFQMRSASKLLISLCLVLAVWEAASEMEQSNASHPELRTSKNGTLGSPAHVEEQSEKFRRSVHLLKTNSKAEFVFLIDSSSSIGEDNYKSQIRFVRKFVADFRLGPADVRIAVVAFASSAQTYVNHLEKAPKFGKCTFLHVELPTLEKLYTGGNTDTIGALLEARRIFNESRKGAAKALFLMTDGFSNKGDPLPTAKALRDEGVIIFTFGIQSGNAQEVRGLSSAPQEDHAFILSSFSDFESLARRALHEDLKSGPYAVLDDPAPCDAHCAAPVFPGATGCCNHQSRCGCGTLTGYFSCLCPPGFYGSGFRGEECRPCPNGTYHDGLTPGDVTVCTPCPDSNHVTLKIPSKSVEDCTCKEGYVSSGGECKVLTCPILKVPENGYFVNKNCSNVLHAACGVLCSTGYKLRGSSVRICQISGKWSGNPPVCMPKSCRKPKPVHGAVMTCKNTDSKREMLVNLDEGGNAVETSVTGQQEDSENSPQQFNFTVDTTCSFKCHPGRSMIGSKTRTCLPILQWNGLSTTCSVVNCPSLPALKDGFVKPENCTVRGLTHDYASQCSITCKSGYLLQGPSLRNCTGRRGTWTAKKIPNKCIDVEPPVFECPNNITTKSISGESYALVYLTLPEGKDNSGLEPIIWSKPPFFPDHPLPMKIGTTKVEIYATDAADNSDLCEFHVQVKDEEIPKVFNCESPATFYVNDGALEVNWTEPLFQDNSNTPLEVEKRIVFGNFSLGTTTLVYLAKDASGNTANCTLNVTIAENPCSDRPRLRDVLWNCTSNSSAATCNLSCPEELAWTTDHNMNNVTFTCLRIGNDALWNPDIFDDLDALPECSSFEVPKKATTSRVIELDGEDVSCEDLERLGNEINLFLSSGEFDDVSMVATCLQDDFQSPDESTAGAPLLDRKKRGTGSKKIGLRLSLLGTSNDTRSSEILEKRVRELKLRMEQKSGNETVIDIGGRKVKIHGAKTVETAKLVCSAGFALKQGLCVRCPPGTFYKLSKSDCVPCPVGHFQPFEGRLQCDPCPAGHLTNRRRRTQAKDCKRICPAGSFGRKKRKRQMLALEPCTPCPVGSYQEKQGQTSCARCPGEKTTSKRGSNRGELCLDKEELRDPCHRYSCMNNGTCSLYEDHPYCTCTEGFLGSRCEKRKNYCDSSPCYHGGECLPAETAKFVCRCPAGYEGDLCQHEVDECASGPCANGAECIDLVNGYGCECAPGFTGDNCEENIDECNLFNPCLNNGTCNDLINGYNCTCPDGFAGDHCEEAFQHPPHGNGYGADEKTRKSANPCAALACPKNAKCVNSPETDNRPTCSCLEGFYGVNCTEEVNFNVILGFPGRSVTDYLSAHFPNENLHRVSVCTWLKTSDTYNYGTVFSYAVSDEDNSFTVTDYKGLVLYVRRQRVITDVAVNDGRWHFLCVTWQSDEGLWAVYLDGENRANGTGLAANSPIPGGGTFVIGQEQDRRGGGFSEIESFVGKITHFDVWKKILRKSEVQDMKENCKYFQGDLVGWTRFLENIHGNVQSTKSNFCTNCDARELRLFGGRTGVRNVGDSIFAVYECDRGFRLAFEDDTVAEDARIWYRKCLKQGNWESTVPKCIRVHCGFPGYFAHGSITGNSYRYPEMIEYRCNGGFDLIGNATRVCLENGSWSGIQPRCRGRAGYCREISAPRYGSMFISFGGERSVQASALGDTAEFVCNEGYRLKGSRILTCTEEGFWSEDVPTCEEIPKSFSKRTEGYGEAPENTAVACNESRTSYAVEDRKNRSLAACDNRCHGRPKHPQHGLFLGEPLKYIYEHGDAIYVRCRYGYKLHGDNFFTCSGNGTWYQGRKTECRPAACVPPISPPNSYAATPLDNYPRGRRITFKCLPGYSQRGNLQTQCDAEGRWTRINGRCLTES